MTANSSIDVSRSSPSWLPFANEQEQKLLERDLHLLSPGSFALAASEGKWRLAKHLDYLDRALLEAIDLAQRQELEGLAVSMPPQHGKSELCSKYLPAWFLGTHPDSRVILASYEAD